MVAKYKNLVTAQVSSSVIPVKTGIQIYAYVDSGLRRNDE
jgi:hypothetical protein